MSPTSPLPEPGLGRQLRNGAREESIQVPCEKAPSRGSSLSSLGCRVLLTVCSTMNWHSITSEELLVVFQNPLWQRSVGSGRRILIALFS